MEIDQFGASAEVDLGCLARCKIKDNRGFGLIVGQGLHKPPYRRVTAGEAVVARMVVPSIPSPTQAWICAR